MATTITVRDLDNYPDNSKTISVSQTTMIPTGAEGDEKWVLSFTTSAYSDNTDRTSIQDIYIQEFKAGWAKSSGLVSAPFTIQEGRKSLGISLDGSDVYDIVLTNGTYGGDSLADHIQELVREVPTTFSGTWNSNDDPLAFMNSAAKFTNGKFYIVSGNVGSHYTGSSKTSAIVSASGVDTLYSYLGFDLGFNSYDLASTYVKESLINEDYTAGDATLYTSFNSGDVSANDALAITDGTDTDYFTALSVSGSEITVATSGVNAFNGISNNYTSGEAKVQVLKMQDPDSVPAIYYDKVDDVMRWGIMSILNQIDFSS